MNSKKTFTLVALGISDVEMRMVRSLCLVSSGRARSYTVIEDRQAANADLWVVDAGMRSAMEMLQKLRLRRHVPVVLIAANGAESQEAYVLRRPIAPSRLLGMLDALVTRELAYVPELVIGGKAEEPGGVAAMLAAKPALASHTALVVDDSATIRKQVELALKAHGVAAVCADSGEAAMAALANGRFDVIFLDVVLPGDTDGYRICRAIKHDPSHKATPVVMLTGKSSPFDRVRGALAGCDTYLTKPVEPETFKAVIRKYLPQADACASPGPAAPHALAAGGTA